MRVLNPDDDKRQRILGTVAKILDFLRSENFFEPFNLNRTADRRVVNHDVGDLATPYQGFELTIGNGFNGFREDEILRDEHQYEGSDEISHGKIFLLVRHDFL